ncbi:hypothetical protein LG324_12860 [Phycicoccus jejuensis]|uniref:hypothetical protein n=1 Tax=Phycicoccus jejuensis TaxID=367299 RepID=UPI00384F5675
MAHSEKTAARQAALRARDRMRAQQAAQERRRSDLAMAATVALVERAGAEQRAGDAMLRLVQDEGLTQAAVVQWCGGPERVTASEVKRLVVAARSRSDSGCAPDGASAG